MKRVGNKPGQLVRSASRRGKASSRFQFDITIDKVFGTKPGAHYQVKWSRGVKVATTKPLPSTKETAGKAGLTVNQKISLMVTLYREEGKRFDSKDAKLSLIAVNPGKKQERTVAKLHFDLSPFAGVPSSSATKLFKLSDRVSIRATIDSRFVKAGTSGPGSAGASSAMSGMTGVSGPSSEEDEGDDDFNDLALDDVPEPEVMSATSAKSRKAPPVGKALGSVPQSKVPLLVETPRATSSSAMEKRKAPAPKPPSPVPAAGSSPRRGVSPVPRMKREKSGLSGDSEDQLAAQRAESEAKIAKLTERNGQLMAELRSARQECQSAQDALQSQEKELKSKIEQHAQEAAAAVASRASSDASLSELSTNRKELEEKVKALKAELVDANKNKDILAAKCKSLQAVEAKNKDLSREVDRLAVAAAAVKRDSAYDSPDNSEIEKRIEELRKEKEALETRLKAHETHAAKVRATYRQLSQMYEDLRDHNAALQKELDETKEKAERQSISEADGREDLLAELDEARQEVRDIEASKDSLESDYNRLLAQVTSLQERLTNTSHLLEDTQREVEDLCEEREELKGQRDMAMQRALSKGKGGSGNENSNARSLGRAEEELRISKEKHEREQSRLTRRIQELEIMVSELREDIDYEKAEKAKARTDRDKIRENARELERKTSHAAQQSDALNSLRRQVSTHQMRAQDHEAMIIDLRSEVSRLQHELDASHANSNHRGAMADDVGDVLRDLVSTKLSLAQTEDDKLNLQFSMKMLKKSEKAIQQRLAAHASRLEVKLGQANEELDRLRGRNPLADATEFNELGSDVDY